MKMIEVVKHQISKDSTEKILLKLSDGEMVESVLMNQDYGYSACISSQAGCNMGCVFCASGIKKKARDLSAEEMYAQVKALSSLHARSLSGVLVNDTLNGEGLSKNEERSGDRISHLVIMGTGEPFDNYDEVIHFCDLISNDKDELFIAPRHITVSTCGIVPKIYEFAKTPKRYNLAVSLHAPTNELRDKLMPVNRKYPLDELMPAASYLALKTKRRVAFEYLLMDGINDADSCAHDLIALLKKHSVEGKDLKDLFYVNLIPYNTISSETSVSGSSKETALAFYDILMKNGVRATLRKERGSDISAACGQLRSENIKDTQN